jgi:AcrR family transcriptional regulator
LKRLFNIANVEREGPVSDDTRQRILAAAGPVFAEKGFQAATVREICQAAEVNLASINYYFGDKERLYIETVKQAHCSRAEVAALPEWPPGTPPEQKLRDFISTMLTRMIGVPVAPWQNELLMRETVEPTQACRELVQEGFRPHFEVLLGILDEVLPAKTPRHKRQQIALSVIGQCLHYHVGRGVIPLLVHPDDLPEKYAPRQLAEHIAGFTLAALGLAPALAQSRKNAKKRPNWPKGQGRPTKPAHRPAR